MKTIGLIGGMSWESTVPYYRQINETVKQQLGGLHSAKVILFSVDFHEIERLQHAGDWDAAGAVLADAARALERAGADCLVPPGTIRGDLGILFTENLIHGSDSAEAAARELGIFFPGL